MRHGYFKGMEPVWDRIFHGLGDGGA